MSLNHSGVHHIIPFDRHKNFTGRDAIVGQITDKFFKLMNCQKLALFGLGGVGKTQVALHFAYWVKDHEPAFSIFWVSALSTASFEQAYKSVFP